MGERTIARVAVSSATYWVDRVYDYLIPDELCLQAVPGKRVIVPFGRGNRRSEAIILAIASGSPFDKLKYIENILDEIPVMTQEQINLAIWMRDRFFCTVYDGVKAMLPAGLWYNLSSVYRLSDGVDREIAYAAVGRSKAQQQVLDIIFAHGGACERSEIDNAFSPGDPSSALAALTKSKILVADGKAMRRAKDKTVEMVTLGIHAEEAMALASAKKRRAPQQAAILELLCAVGKAPQKEITYFTGAGAQSIKRLEAEGVVKIHAEEVFRRPKYFSGATAPVPQLNQSQKNAFDELSELMSRDKAEAALLFGVTGSGKTSVYIHLIQQALDQGKSSILLVPEIALTPQMLNTFSSHFGDEIAVLHSSLAMGERYDEWKRIKSGSARVVIGTRSAVFAPVSDLGIIIIDEEQEESYKSENAPRYHAREVAKYRCASSGALLLMASATPDICSRYYAEKGRYHFFQLPERYNQMSLPDVHIVDMKRELRRGNGGSISSVLRNEIEENLSRGEQSILFINRRGASKLVTCAECGYTYKCPRCSVSLTYHSANRRLMCHYCGHSQAVDEACPECGGRLSFSGDGTQKVVLELQELFPDVRILRMDTDTVSPAGSHDALLSSFREGNIPIMVGTQMVTKGLNFENVTLVGVISADQSLYSGDYRAGEKTFSLITQVVGRSGRGTKAGRAVIQTFTPENQTILQAASQDYDSFYHSEIQLRQIQNCPPFAGIFAITASGMNEMDVLGCCSAIRSILKTKLAEQKNVRILGPAPLPVVKVNNRYRYRVILSCEGSKHIRALISDIVVYCNSNKQFKNVSVFADTDPYD